MPPSADARRAYRYVKFVQDKESGEIRLYLTKPLTPADAQVVPYDTYAEVKLIKPAQAVDTEKPDGVPEFIPQATAVNEAVASETPTERLLSEAAQDEQRTVQEQIEETFAADDTPPTLRSASIPSASQTGPEPESAVEESAEIEAAPEFVARAETEEPREVEREEAPSRVELMPSNKPAERIGGPSYVGFDLNKVPVTQLTFKGKPFREALLELVGETGYNVVVSDEVDNSEVYLNFNQKKLSLKSALDLLSLTFDLQWSLEDDAIVVKAKSQ